MKRVAHIGCGPTHVPAVLFAPGEWEEVRVDLDPAVRPDVVAPMHDLPFADGAIDAVFTAHTLEHIEPRQVPVALRELARVLRSKGVVVIQVPDLQAAAREIAEGRGGDVAYVAPCGPITPFDMVFGHSGMTEGNPFMAHRCGFTIDTLHGLLAAAGFKDVQVIASNWAIDAVGVKDADSP